MSIETHPSAAGFEESRLPQETIEEINSIGLEADRRELSPFANGVDAAADRISRFLNDRVTNAAHSEALKEYREDDIADYTDHLAKLSDVQVEGDMAMTERQQSFAQDALNKENNIIDREEAIDHAKSKLKGFGRSALSFLKGAGKISAAVGITTLGVGIVGGVSAGKGIARGASAVVDKGVQTSAFIDKKVEAGYNAYDKAASVVSETWNESKQAAKDAWTDSKQAVKDAAFETKWRATGATESAVDSLKSKVTSVKFEAGQAIKEANPLPDLKDEFNLMKAGASDLKFEASMWKNAMLERAGAALKRKAERARAFKERNVERFNDTREAAKKQSKRIGHRALTTLAFAHESGQEFIDKVKSSREEEKTYTE